jgi:hypothetical protein
MRGAAKCRISTISEDWVTKGCHVHVGQVEIALRPDHELGIVCRAVYSKTPDSEVEAAGRVVSEALEDPDWRAKLKDTLERAMDFYQGIEGKKKPQARGGLRELRMLLVALQRREPTG